MHLVEQKEGVEVRNERIANRAENTGVCRQCVLVSGDNSPDSSDRHYTQNRTPEEYLKQPAESLTHPLWDDYEKLGRCAVFFK